MRKWILLLLGVMLVGGFVWMSEPSGERFIIKNFRNENGMLATNRLQETEQDEDEVSGREALSESSGLWLLYLLEKGERQDFHAHWQLVKRYMLTEEGLLLWKVSEQGERNTSVNALIDDLRIAEALYKAAEQYNEPAYRKEADGIIKGVQMYNRNASFYVDYYNRKTGKRADALTVSYLNPLALQLAAKNGALSDETYREAVQFLRGLPRHGWAFPKTYQNGRFFFDQTVNLIDQSYVAYHRMLAGIASPSYVEFLKQQFEQNKRLYGRYDKTGKPVVSYESSALYGLTVLFLQEAGEPELAEDMYGRMKELQEQNPLSPFFGGYMNGDGNTHIFDNLLPLLAGS